MARKKQLSKNKPPDKAVSQPSPDQKLVQLLHQEFSGPLPHPSILRSYDQVKEGFADRIIAMAESEAKHRHQLETSSLTADIKLQNRKFDEARLGQVFGLVIGCVAIGGGVYASVHGAQIAGTFIGGSGVIGLVSVFILGRKRQAVEPQSKSEK